MSGTERLPAKKERAVIALLEHQTIKAAARAARVGESTLRRWLSADEAFRARLREAQRVVFDEGIGALQALTPRAAAALARAVDSGRTEHEMRAADVIYKHGIKGKELEIAERIERIEKLLKESGRLK